MPKDIQIKEDNLSNLLNQICEPRKSRLAVFEHLSASLALDEAEEDTMDQLKAKDTHSDNLSCGSEEDNNFGTTRSNSDQSFSSKDSERSTSYTRDRSQSVLYAKSNTMMS